MSALNRTVNTLRLTDRSIMLAFLLLAVVYGAAADSGRELRHSLYAEMQVTATAYPRTKSEENLYLSSLNYELLLNDRLVLRSGGIALPTYLATHWVIGWLLGQGESRIEIGAGVFTLTTWRELSSPPMLDLNWFPTGVIAYRRHPASGAGPIFRLGVTPGPLFFIPSLKVSLGYSLQAR